MNQGIFAGRTAGITFGKYRNAAAYRFVFDAAAVVRRSDEKR